MVNYAVRTREKTTATKLSGCPRCDGPWLRACEDYREYWCLYCGYRTYPAADTRSPKYLRN